MKRRLICIILAVLCAFSLSSCADRGNESQVEEIDPNAKAPVQSMFATEYDISEMRWYMSDVYDIDAAESCYFYAIDDGTDSFLLAQMIESREGVPDYLLHAFASGISEWYLHDTQIIEVSSMRTAARTPDGGRIIELVFSYNGRPVMIYIKPAPNGRIEKLLCTRDKASDAYIGYDFKYNSGGGIEGFTKYSSNYRDGFFGEKNGYAYEGVCIYNENGSLNELYQTYRNYENGKITVEDDDMFVHMTFSYTMTGERKKIISNGSGSTTVSLEMKYNAEGLMHEVSLYNEYGDREYVKYVNYYPGGMASYDW